MVSWREWQVLTVEKCWLAEEQKEDTNYLFPVIQDIKNND